MGSNPTCVHQSYPCVDELVKSSLLVGQKGSKDLGGSTPLSGAQFCKCQQENVMLSRFLRRTKTVEGDGFNSQPLARVVSVTETNWTSIPSDVPNPARAC